MAVDALRAEHGVAGRGVLQPVHAMPIGARHAVCRAAAAVVGLVLVRRLPLARALTAASATGAHGAGRSRKAGRQGQEGNSPGCHRGGLPEDSKKQLSPMMSAATIAAPRVPARPDAKLRALAPFEVTYRLIAMDTRTIAIAALVIAVVVVIILFVL